MGIGINIRSTKNRRYALDIAQGLKTLETRNSDSLRAYIGERVGLIETGRGRAMLVGFATVGDPIEISSADFDDHYASHLVAPGDDFYPEPGSSKQCYPMLNAESCEPRAIYSFGIRSRKI